MRILIACTLLVVLGALGLGGGLALIPSDPAPMPGAQITLQVSGAPAGAEFFWDFGGDGSVDQITQVPTISYTVKAGYQEIAVQVHHQGKAIASARIALSSDPSLGAFRSVQGTGPIQVTVVLRARIHLVAPGIEETVPAGWAVEVVDDGGALYKIGDALQAVWPLELWPDEEVSFCYRLYPGEPATARLSGIASAYGPEGRIEVRIGGVVIVP